MNELRERLDARLGTLTAGGMFDPNQHPRGQDGRYITIGGTVQTTDSTGRPVAEGKVTAVNPGGSVTVRDSKTGVSAQVPASRLRQAPVREATIGGGPSKHLTERKARLDHAAAHHRADIAQQKALASIKAKPGSPQDHLLRRKARLDHAAAHHAADLAYEKTTGHPMPAPVKPGTISTTNTPDGRIHEDDPGWNAATMGNKRGTTPTAPAAPTTPTAHTTAPAHAIAPPLKPTPSGAIASRGTNGEHGMAHDPSAARAQAIADFKAHRKPLDEGDPQALYAYTQAYKHAREQRQREVARKAAHEAAHYKRLSRRLKAEARKRAAATKKSAAASKKGAPRYVAYHPTNPVTSTKAGKTHLGA